MTPWRQPRRCPVCGVRCPSVLEGSSVSACPHLTLSHSWTRDTVTVWLRFDGSPELPVSFESGSRIPLRRLTRRIRAWRRDWAVSEVMSS